MTQINHNNAELLGESLRQGLLGLTPYDQFRDDLRSLEDQLEGARFSLTTADQKSVIFCAGSWAVGLLLGSELVIPKITILGETGDGPQTVNLSQLENREFTIAHHTTA